MTSEQIIRYLTMLDPATSHQQVLRRLQLLFYRHFLDRPAAQATRKDGAPGIDGVTAAD